MSITRVKICGITRPEDAALAAKFRADYVGLNFYQGPRRISFTSGEAILNILPTTVTPVGLFFEEDKIQSTEGDSQVFCLHRIQVKQVYGIARGILSTLDWDATKVSVDSHLKPQDKPYLWLPVTVSSRKSFSKMAWLLHKLYASLGGVLLDAAAQGKAGGTGQSFNWNWIAEARAAGELDGLPPIILAGGLTPDNVAEAIRIARPYAVDVSSGVEVPGKPGVKDPIKMRDFIQAAKGA